MKVRALIDCTGVGYNFKKNDTADLNKKIANKLITFGYVEEIKKSKAQEKVNK